jgi:uncharacterized protein YneF (UPF0154 family)
MAEKTNMGAVLQFARDIDKKHDDSHGRLRHDLDQAESRVLALEGWKHGIEERLKLEAESPIDVGKIVFNPRMVLAVVGLVVSIITGNWLTTWPVRESLVRIQEQFTDNVKLQDERFRAMTDKIDNVQRQMEMRRLEIQQVNNDVQQLRKDK